MQHADPWDENTRLEEQMDTELLAEFEDTIPASVHVDDEDPAGTERDPSRTQAVPRRLGV